MYKYTDDVIQHTSSYTFGAHTQMIPLIVMSQQSFPLVQNGASLHAWVRRLW